MQLNLSIAGNARVRPILPKLLCLSVAVWLTGGHSRAGESGLLFHLPFEGNLTAEIANGKSEGEVRKSGNEQVTFVEGVKGQALLARNTAITFPIRDCFSVSQGSVCFWVKPVDWDPEKPSENWNTFFDAYQQSGAGGDDKIAFWRYPKTMSEGFYNYHSAQGNNLDNFMLKLPDWKQDQWRFFVFTWAKDGTSKLFVDGKRIAVTTRPKERLPVTITKLTIGGGGSAYDEFKVYAFPLGEEEVERQFRSVQLRETIGAQSKWEFPAGPSTVCASPMTGKIALDGKLDEPAWAGCVEVQDMQIAGGGFPADPTSFRIGYTAEALYLGVVVTSKSVKPRMTVRDHDGPVYSDDSTELFVSPQPGGADYYQFVANALGAQYEGLRMDKGWNGVWEVAAARGQGKWALEIAIPFATLGVQPATGKVLGFNLCRNDASAGGEWQTWSHLPAGGYHQPAHFGRLILGDRPLGIENLLIQRNPEGSALINASTTNLTDQSATVSVGLQLKSRAGSFSPMAEVEIGGGKTAPIHLAVPEAFQQVGNVSIGMVVRNGDRLLYLSPGRELPFDSVAVAGDTGKLISLENNKVAFTFNALSGDLVTVTNKVTRTEYRPRQQGAPVFSLDTVMFKTKPLHFSEDDVQVLRPNAGTCQECKVEKGSLLQRHRFPCGVEVEVRVTLPADSEISQWELTLNNTVTSHPSRSVVVHRVAFPLLHGLRVDDSDSKQSLAIPQICGLLVPSPAANLPKMPSYMLSTERGFDRDYLSGRYSPSWLSMTWMDLSGTRGGLYVASHDKDPMYDTRFDASNDQSNGELELAVTRWSYLWPGEKWQPGPCSVGVHSGDWHWSADRYREWFYGTFKPRPLPKWLRECNGWSESGGGRCTYTWNDLPDAVLRGKPFGLTYLQKWCNMTGGDMGYAAFPYPNPYAGSFFEFKRAVDKIHELGGHLGFYHNLTTGDPALGRFAGQARYRQKIPPDVPLPDANPFKGGWLDACKIAPDGGYHAGGGEACYLDGYWWNCWGANGWMDFCFDWMATRWRKQYKLDACYLDSTGPYCCPCFNLKHGHDRPAGQSQLLLDFYKRLAEGTDADYAICQEFVWDRLMVHGTHSLTTFHPGPFSEPALYRYTHPDYPLFCGCINFFGGRADLLDGVLKDPTWPEFLGYVYLYGGRFDHYGVSDALSGPDEQLGPALREEKAVLVLRNTLRDDLNSKTDFRDQIGLSGLPDRFFSRVFVRRDKTATLLTVFDLRQTKDAFSLSLDLKAHGLSQAGGATLITGGAEPQALPAPSVSDGIAKVNVPPFTGKVAAILISTKGGSK